MTITLNIPIDAILQTIEFLANLVTVIMFFQVLRTTNKINKNVTSINHKLKMINKSVNKQEASQNVIIGPEIFSGNKVKNNSQR